MSRFLREELDRLDRAILGAIAVLAPLFALACMRGWL